MDDNCFECRFDQLMDIMRTVLFNPHIDIDIADKIGQHVCSELRNLMVNVKGEKK